jgi:uncharacterized membrane protein
VTAWFVPWALGLATTYVSAILVVSIAVRDLFSPDLDAFYAEVRQIALVTGGIALALNAVAAFFLAQMARQWSAVQEGPPVS